MDYLLCYYINATGDTDYEFFKTEGELIEYIKDHKKHIKPTFATHIIKHEPIDWEGA